MWRSFNHFTVFIHDLAGLFFKVGHFFFDYFDLVLLFFIVIIHKSHTIVHITYLCFHVLNFNIHCSHIHFQGTESMVYSVLRFNDICSSLSHIFLNDSRMPIFGRFCIGDTHPTNDAGGLRTKWYTLIYLSK